MLAIHLLYMLEITLCNTPEQNSRIHYQQAVRLLVGVHLCPKILITYLQTATPLTAYC